MQNLANQKLQLKQLVTGENGIAAAIESLKMLIPTDSPKYNGLLQLEADFNQVKLNDVKGIISEEQFRLAINQIRERLIQLIDLLHDQDFQPPIVNTNTTPIKKRNYTPYFIGGGVLILLGIVLVWKPWPVVSMMPEMVLVEGNAATGGDFYICKYETTVKEFKAFMEATSYKTSGEVEQLAVLWKNDAPDYRKSQGINWQYDANGTKRTDPVYDTYPVIFVSRDDAIAYADWLSKKTGTTYKLPTKAQWQYAAKGGNRSKSYSYFGGNNLNAIAWYRENASFTTHPVGKKQPNELGLYDMNGNVWEWCTEQYPGTEKYYALGGGWTGGEEWCRPENEAYGLENSTSFIGFRLMSK